MPLLFSYGTLQQDDVQLKTVGRLLGAHPDELPEFELSRNRDGRHANVTFNGRSDSRVGGAVLEITDAELGAVDEYERVDGYARIVVTLGSGKQAWVFVEA